MSRLDAICSWKSLFAVSWVLFPTTSKDNRDKAKQKLRVCSRVARALLSNPVSKNILRLLRIGSIKSLISDFNTASIPPSSSFRTTSAGVTHMWELRPRTRINWRDFKPSRMLREESAKNSTVSFRKGIKLYNVLKAESLWDSSDIVSAFAANSSTSSPVCVSVSSPQKNKVTNQNGKRRQKPRDEVDWNATVGERNLESNLVPVTEHLRQRRAQALVSRPFCQDCLSRWRHFPICLDDEAKPGRRR